MPPLVQIDQVMLGHGLTATDTTTVPRRRHRPSGPRRHAGHRRCGVGSLPCESRWSSLRSSAPRTSASSAGTAHGRAVRPGRGGRVHGRLPATVVADRWLVDRGVHAGAEGARGRGPVDPRRDIPAFRAHVGDDWCLWSNDGGTLRPLDDRFPDVLNVESQIWVRRSAHEPWVIDLPITPDREGRWTNKRDPDHELPSRRPPGWPTTGSGYLRPEISLLYKAARHRPKDERDLRVTWPLLGEREQTWLREAVSRLYVAARAVDGGQYRRRLRARLGDRYGSDADDLRCRRGPRCRQARTRRHLRRRRRADAHSLRRFGQARQRDGADGRARSQWRARRRRQPQGERFSRHSSCL